MAENKLKILVTRKLPAEVERRLAELFEVRSNAGEGAMTSEGILEGLQDCDVLACTLGDRIDADFISRLPERIRLITNFGAGVDHIDIVAAEKRGITVTNTPSVLTEDAADMAMALILAVPRRLVEGVEVLRRGEFTGWTPTWMLGRRVRGKKLGIIGLGRVGQAVAQRARAFGISIHYHNRNPINPHIENDLEATYWDNLDQMLPSVDIVSVNCPMTPATRHLLSRERLGLLRKDAYIVNISRGDVVDEAALADMIVSGNIAGAGLDVFSKEPAVSEKLLDAPNVVLLPHMASATKESRIEMGERMLINIKMFADGHKPPDRIIPAML